MSDNSSNSDQITGFIGQTKREVFFVRKSLEGRKKKPKPMVYYIYHCNQYKTSPEDENKEIGAWASLVIQQPQESMTNYDDAVKNTCMLSADHVYGDNNHIRIRLDGILESLVWITSNVKQEQLGIVEANIVSNDVFVVNSLREWIPKWEKLNYQVSKQDNIKRPHSDLMEKIGSISTKIKLSISWQSEKSHEMSILTQKVNSILSVAENNLDQKS